MALDNKKTYAALFLLLLFVFIINVVSLTDGHDWGDDFASFISAAKSIAEGTMDEFISINKYRVKNSTLWIGPVDGEWGTCLLLSPVYHVFGLDVHAMKIYLVFFFSLSLLSLFLLLRDKLDNLQSLLLTAVLGFNPWFFEFKDHISSDMPYLFFSLATLLLIQRFIISDKIWINKSTSYFLLGFFMFFSSFTRPFGFLLVPTLLCAQFFHNRGTLRNFIFSDRIKFMPYIIFFVLNAASVWFFSSEDITGGEYGHLNKLFNEIRLSSIIMNIKYYIVLPARYFPYLFVKYSVFGLGYDKIHLILYLIMLFFVVSGMIRNRKDDYMYIWYVLFNLVLVIIFPPRAPWYVMPIFPFFIYFLFAGLKGISLSLDLSDKVRFTNINAAYLFCIGLILISFVYMLHTAYKSIIFNKSGQVVDGPYSPDSVEMFNYIKKNTNKDDAIIFHKPRAMTLYTDRKSFAMDHFTFTPDKAYDSDAKYIVIAKKKYIDFDLRFDDFQGKLECEFENNSFYLCDLKKNRSR
ncbi:MAG: hypothetical protein C4526_02205 [Nitrospiraceae bacterium]|nr:MAG: hypothetical protein C4526_02205 [Nitrospiraceae bacterium]